MKTWSERRETSPVRAGVVLSRYVDVASSSYCNNLTTSTQSSRRTEEASAAD